MQTASPGAAANRARTTAADIARIVVEGLEAGEFSPGQRMVEADLCLRFGVGRQIVREALQHLHAIGVVALEPNRGAHIIHVTRDQAVMTLELTELLFGLVSRTAARRIAAGADARRLVGRDRRELLRLGANARPRRLYARAPPFVCRAVTYRGAIPS
jgi:DNA-binding GntR family transcriptional regulator